MNITKKIRSIAIYLPQYHPIPENDEWWGKGFTEWTNVSKARPLFKGHYQPHLPADLGFYDLRLEETRIAQAALAKQYGIHGFCYYHYWFNGKRILERPFQEVFESGKPDFPFMLCWANENWTRVWDGGDKSILLEQKYSEEDDREHIRSLIPYFKDERYIKIGGKPVFAVYKSTLLPNAKTTTDIWREEAAKEGLELYLCRFEAFGVFGEQYITEGGFDAGIEFQPFSKVLFDFKQQLSENKKHKYFMRLISKIKKEVLRKWSNEAYTSYISKEYGIVDYTDFIQYAKNYQLPKYKSFPGITPSWDNSARRRQNYFIMKNATPELYKEWLQYIAANFTPHSNEENFIFINAWNEWAEGNHLEPCQKWGLDYLKATQDALV